jgi:hypothetical protein
MFFELYLLHEVMTKYGLNIIYIFYGAFDRRPSNIIDRQKNELEKIGDFDAIYMDDISYSGTQFLIDTKHLLKIVKNRMFVFFYAMLPKSLERFYSFLLKKQKKIPNIKDLITIYTHKIIVHPFYFLSKLIRGREPLNISYTIQDMCFQSEKKENSSPFQNMENSSPFQNMLYFVIDANMDGDYDRFISMQNRLVRLQLVYIEEKLKETLKIFPERKNLNVAEKILDLYYNAPMVVTNYKIPDGHSLSPLYFGIIHKELKNPETILESVKNDQEENVYSFPMWRSESGAIKIKNQNFKKPWYKNIPIKNIAF